MTLICQDSQANSPGLSDRQATAIARSIAFQHQLEAYQQVLSAADCLSS